MKYLVIQVVMLLLLCISTHAEMRTWTKVTGETVEGEYVRQAFDTAVLKGADGKEMKIAIAELSAEDFRYLELCNPPALTVDFLKSERQYEPTPSPMWVNNSPVKVFYTKFGARVKQTSNKSYNYDLRVVIYVFTQQIYDPSKYKMIARIEHGPFRLTDENGRRYEFEDKGEVEILEFLIESQYPRGTKFAESLVLVYDERDEVIAYNTTKNWLYNNLDKLETYPLGAWIDKKCIRTHPTSPKPIWLD